MVNKILEVAKEASLCGGELALDFTKRGFSVGSKAEFNLVTEADFAVEQAVVSLIKESFPDHSFLGEETFKDSTAAEHLWIIDPIDGTNNFAHSFPHYACSVAYYHNGQPTVGAVYNPTSRELFWAQLGEGAYLGDKRIKASACEKLSEALIGTGFYYDRGALMEATLSAIRELFLKKIHGIRRVGAASLDFCYIACGRFDAYFEYGLEPWDYAAAALIAKEAGAIVSDARGEMLPIKKSSVLAAGTLELYEEVLSIVKPLHP